MLAAHLRSPVKLPPPKALHSRRWILTCLWLTFKLKLPASRELDMTADTATTSHDTAPTDPTHLLRALHCCAQGSLHLGLVLRLLTCSSLNCGLALLGLSLFLRLPSGLLLTCTQSAQRFICVQWGQGLVGPAVPLCSMVVPANIYAPGLACLPPACAYVLPGRCSACKRAQA